jgi:hypothetical protein
MQMNGTNSADAARKSVYLRTAQFIPNSAGNFLPEPQV